MHASLRTLTACGLATICGVLAGVGTDAVRAKARPPVQTIDVAQDEDLTFRFKRRVRERNVDAGTIRIRTDDGREATGNFVAGTFLVDPAASRRVVIRPEAVQEYYRLVENLPRAEATRQADRLLGKINKKSKLKKLAAIDRELRTFFGPSYGAGTRLDDPQVFAMYPSNRTDFTEVGQYREAIAGDDALWHAHFADSDLTAFPQLRSNSEYERFFHITDPETGVPEANSVLRNREHRRVLIARSRKLVTFVPAVPIRQDLTDAAFEQDTVYNIEVRSPLRGSKHVARGDGLTAVLSAGTAILRTSAEPTFRNAEGRPLGTGDRDQEPRVVNVTPPNGEIQVDGTTDWEDPDNVFEVPLAVRKPFTIRVRFAHPLDPRSVTPANFTLAKVKLNPRTLEEEHVQIDVPVNVFLDQSRLGDVRVDVTPVQFLEADAQFELVVRQVKSLGGELQGVDNRFVFDTR